MNFGVVLNLDYPELIFTIKGRPIENLTPLYYINYGVVILKKCTYFFDLGTLGTPNSLRLPVIKSA